MIIKIPTTPAIICAKKLVRGNTIKTGAFPCLDIVTLDEYIDALDSDKIEQIIE
ncbi:hypothetical protein L3V83_02835 [Thiotrichales bacterium 19X7-9]|nr:hypothetical protein [Thiotrichales bacterium 19X7-9]